jgi:aryl-alcohol dehydrogenase-like predicted oxidoreductase
MRTQRLGSRGPEMTVIGFGAWEAGGDAWGPNPSDDRVVAAIRSAIDAGIGWIDTAEVYGGGVSERLVGRAVQGRRDDVLLATKVAPRPEGTGFRPEQIRTAIRASLDRLGTERVDLYQLHWPDGDGTPVEDSWAAMAGLVDDGLVRWIGASNFDRALIERCEAIRHVDSLQQQFSMLALEDRELIRWCGEAGTGVVTYGPLGFGLLTDAFDREKAEAVDDWRTSEDEAAFTPERLDAAFRLLDGMRPISERLGCTVAQLALAWNWHQPGVTSAIAGSRDAEHVRQNAAAGEVEPDGTVLAELEKLLPGP